MGRNLKIKTILSLLYCFAHVTVTFEIALGCIYRNFYFAARLDSGNFTALALSNQLGIIDYHSFAVAENPKELQTLVLT
jgi:hypothetical protein